MPSHLLRGFLHASASLQCKVVNSCFFSKLFPDYLMKGA
jgi:hypothetical protein